MKKKFIVAILVLVVTLSFSACNQAQEQLQNSDIGSTIKSFIKGDVTGELNKSYSTKWFDFNVKTIKSAYEYGEYEADEGYKFVIAAITETNTFTEPIPMGTFDFYIDADGLLEEDSYPLEAFDERMMPDEFELAIGETQEYDIVFIIPEEIIDVRIIYIEVDDQDNIGATFTINHSL